MKCANYNQCYHYKETKNDKCQLCGCGNICVCVSVCVFVDCIFLGAMVKTQFLYQIQIICVVIFIHVLYNLFTYLNSYFYVLFSLSPQLSFLVLGRFVFSLPFCFSFSGFLFILAQHNFTSIVYFICGLAVLSCGLSVYFRVIRSFFAFQFFAQLAINSTVVADTDRGMCFYFVLEGLYSNVRRGVRLDQKNVCPRRQNIATRSIQFA